MYPWIYALLVTTVHGFHIINFKNTGVLFTYNRLPVFLIQTFFKHLFITFIISGIILWPFGEMLKKKKC
jgi:hypothetical protein